MRFTRVLVAALCLAGCQSAGARPPLQQVSQELQRLATRARPAVVHIRVRGYAPGADPTQPLVRPRGGSGSGFVFSSDGLVLTNAHVVAGALDIVVELPPEHGGASILPPASRAVPATLVGMDRETDLAVLRIKAPAKLDVLPFGDSDTLRSGQLVVAMGSPFGFEGTVSMGVVSNVARQLEPDSPMVYVQTDAPINPGNSGGPLLNLTGQVVGINSLIYSETGGSVGIGFAVPANIARYVANQIVAHGRVRRGTLGIEAQTITPALAKALSLPATSGVVVSDVFPYSPADVADIRPGDVVVSLDGKPMENARQFDVNIYQRRADQAVDLVVARGTDRSEMTIVVAERPVFPSELARLADPRQNIVAPLGIVGLEITQTTAMLLPQLRERSGVIVVASNRPPNRKFSVLRPGDVIHRVNRKEVKTLAGLRAALKDAGSSAALRVERQSRYRFVLVELE